MTWPVPMGWSRIPGTHRCADNGATVDLATCRAPDNLGSAELSTTWSDPMFDVSQRAFYYVRSARESDLSVDRPSCLGPARSDA